VYLPYAALWAVGGTAVLALTDARIGGWYPDLGVLVTAVTLAVNMLMLRALDDLRDHRYDIEHHPGRPLARGAVLRRDLYPMIAAGAVFVLAINTWRWPVLLVLAAELAYAAVVFWADHRFGWPAGDDVVLGIAVNLPVQVLVNGFLYAGLLYSTGRAPSWSGAGGIAVLVLAFLHLEFSRKVTRELRPGERSYVTKFGVTGTAALSVGCAVLSAVLLIGLAEAAGGGAGKWLALLPLAAVALGLRRFTGGATRWPAGPPALFLLGGFALFQVIAVVEKVTAP
jgi:hypothetical protein